MQRTKLTPSADNQKSYYGKAHVITLDDGTVALQSYKTIVAAILPEGKLFLRGWYSATTARHIKSLLYYTGAARQFNLDGTGVSFKRQVEIRSESERGLFDWGELERKAGL